MIEQGEKDARMIEFNPRFREALEMMENTSYISKSLSSDLIIGTRISVKPY